MATTLALQSDSYPKAASQSGHADVPLVPRSARAVSGHVSDCRHYQSGLARDFPSSQTRLNRAKTRSSRIARCDCVIDKKRRVNDNAKDLARKTISAWRHLGGKLRQFLDLFRTRHGH